MYKFPQGMENAARDAAKTSKMNDSNAGKDLMETEECEDKTKLDSDGPVVATCEVQRGPQSSIHTNLSLLSLNVSFSAICCFLFCFSFLGKTCFGILFANCEMVCS